MESYLRVNLLGPGPSSYKKIIYRAAVSQSLGNTGLWCTEHMTGGHITSWSKLKFSHPRCVYEYINWTKTIRQTQNRVLCLTDYFYPVEVNLRFAHTHARTHTPIYTHAHIHTNTHKNTRAHTYTRTHPHIHTQIHIYVYLYITGNVHFLYHISSLRRLRIQTFFKTIW
jgi:hypothetical protein